MPRLDATKCVKDIFDPQFPHNDASPEEFGNDTIISQECVITLCLLKVFFSFMKGSDKVREKYTIPSWLDLTISFRFFSFSLSFFFVFFYITFTLTFRTFPLKPIYVITQSIILNYPVILSHRRSTAVLLNITHYIHRASSQFIGKITHAVYCEDSILYRG